MYYILDKDKNPKEALKGHQKAIKYLNENLEKMAKNNPIRTAVRNKAIRQGKTLEKLALERGVQPSAISNTINGDPKLSTLKDLLNSVDLRIAIIDEVQGRKLIIYI